MAVNPSHGDSGKTIWEQGFVWIQTHPAELITIITLTVIIYYFLKWITKYWAHEVYLYRPEMQYSRRIGRMIWAHKDTRDIPGSILCKGCNTRYIEYNLENFVCPKASCVDAERIIEKKSQENVIYLNMKVMEQLFPPKFKVLTVNYDKVSYFKKKFLPIENFKNKRLYQRIGFEGINVFWNRKWKVYEVCDDFLKSGNWKREEFMGALRDTLIDADNVVMHSMNSNPNIIQRDLRESSITLPPEN